MVSLGLILSIAAAACGGSLAGATADATQPARGAVTPAPEPGAFGCPAQVLAGSPPTSRLVDVRVTNEGSFDRVTFVFEPGPPDLPAEASGLIVRPFGVPPREDAEGRPLALLGTTFIEVRFRDMALLDGRGGSAFRGSRDLRPADGVVAQVVEIEESPRALDWLIGIEGSGCARTWVDTAKLELHVDVQR